MNKLANMTSWQELKKRMLKNPKVRKYYDELGPEFELIEKKIRKQLKKESKSARLKVYGE